MKKSKIILATALAIVVLALGGYALVNTVVPQTIERHTSYTAEVRTPEFLIEHSDIVIQGKIIGKTAPAKGRQAGARKDEVVYRDTSVKVENVLANKSGKEVQAGAKVLVRTLGGTAGNLTFKTDTETILQQSGDKMLLFLVDASKDPSIPTGDSQLYTVVGGFHGSFKLTPDGSDIREVNGDKFKYADLLAKLKTS